MLSEHYELYNLNNLTTKIDFSRKAIPFMTAKATIFDVNLNSHFVFAATFVHSK